MTPTTCCTLRPTLSGSAADRQAAATALAENLVGDFTDLLECGRLTRHPDLVAHDLDRLKLVTGRVRSAVREDRTIGNWIPLPAGTACTEHTRALAGRADTCGCRTAAPDVLILMPECGLAHGLPTT
ncbi:hypothetical protein ABTY61_05760 [Kitasatospora sp. NPDC096128]|uniref:hypothetical protein n=1 Tax=Kitasatospora sp. NPDC096128 TaxID=3155547 RepID=UPI00331A430D